MNNFRRDFVFVYYDMPFSHHHVLDYLTVNKPSSSV